MSSSTALQLRTDGNCSICLCNKTRDLAAISCCKHTFHEHCIKSWSQITNKCPFCKLRFKYITSLTSNTLFSVENREQRSERDDLSHDTIENEEYWDTKLCEICGSTDSSNDSLALICDGCDNVYHTFCVGLGYIVPSDPIWFCSQCHHLSDSFQDIIKSEVIYKDDLSDFDSNEELSDDIFSKPSKNNEDEEWIPKRYKNEKRNQYHHDFGTINKINHNDKKKKKNKSRKKSKRIQSIKIKEYELCEICGQSFDDKNTLKIHCKIQHILDIDKESIDSFDTVNDIIHEYQELNIIEKKEKKRIIRDWEWKCNDDASKDYYSPLKKRKIIKDSYNGNDYNRNDINDHNDPSNVNYYGHTTKCEGFEVIQNKMGQEMWCFTFKKKKRKKKTNKKTKKP